MNCKVNNIYNAPICSKTFHFFWNLLVLLLNEVCMLVVFVAVALYALWNTS